MTQAIVKSERGDLIPETRNMAELAKHLMESGMFPNAGKLAGIITIIEYGRELGLPPVAALNTMVVVRGKLTMEAKAMLAVANKIAGVTWRVEQLDDTACVMVFERHGFAPCRVSYTADEAKTAGLLSKDNWKLYRQDMLFARCASRGVRRIAPDAVLGLYSVEEMRDVEQTAKQDMEGAAKPEGEPDAKGDPPVYEPPPGEEDEPFVGDDAPADPAGNGQEFGKAEEEGPTGEPDDTILNTHIAEIHFALKTAEIDEQKFKEWLIEQGKKMNRKYVGRIGQTLRFHKGNPDDVKYLNGVISKAIALYQKGAGI